MKFFIASTLMLALVGTANAEIRKLSIDDALNLALHHSTDMRAAQARADAASDTALSTGAHILPSGILNEEWQYYEHPFDIAFGPIVFQARDKSTNTFVAAVDQSLTGLFQTVPGYMAANAQADAAKADSRATVSMVKEGLRNGFLRYFEAKDAEGIAQASEKQLAEQISVADARLKVGTLTTNDVLRLKVAAANARQQEISAQAQSRVIRAQLLSVIGLPLDGEIDFVEPTALEAQAAATVVPDVKSAREQAFHLRPELVSARAHQTAAKRLRLGSIAALLPEVDFDAAYVRVDGQAFAPKDSYYLGVKASWQVWTWGSTMFAAMAAGKNAEAAAAQAEGEQDHIAVDVATKLASLEAADAALTSAKASIASAEEAFRVTQALVNAGSATTTDLLNDQSALTTARLNLSRATYERAIAQVSLDRATGKD